MKIFIKLLFVFVALSIATESSFAQTTKAKTKSSSKKTTSTKTKTTVAKPAAVAPPRDITITLQNDHEGSVMVFAGHKEDLKNPKPNAMGGLSKNKLYLKTNDVVCIVVNGKPTACAEVKPTTVTLKINPSATQISEK